jgi:hypothetical protein
VENLLRWLLVLMVVVIPHSACFCAHPEADQHHNSSEAPIEMAAIEGEHDCDCECGSEDRKRTASIHIFQQAHEVDATLPLTFPLDTIRPLPSGTAWQLQHPLVSHVPVYLATARLRP